MSDTAERVLTDLVFVGLNGKVVALDRYSGEEVWQWKASKGGGFVSLLVDGDRLVVAVNGYVYCLDPIYGQEVWSNPLRGRGIGITTLASVNGVTGAAPAAGIAQQRAAATAAAS